MTVWAVPNQKGGVGKTTTTVALEGLLPAWGFRTLMIDIDPPASRTGCFGTDPDGLTKRVYSLFEAAAAQQALDPMTLVCETDTEGLCRLLNPTAPEDRIRHG